MSPSKWFASALGAALVIAAAAQPARSQTLYEGARLITGDGSVIENSAFFVRDNLFMQVGRKGEIPLPAGGTRVDLTGKTVMPALVDLHGHLGFQDLANAKMSKEMFTRENLIDHLQRFAYNGVGAVVGAVGGNQFRVAPDRLAVFSPIATQGPARKRLAGIPLALPEMQHMAGREKLREAVVQGQGQLQLFRRQGHRVPLRTLHVVDADEGGLAPLREAHIVREQMLVHLLAQGEDSLPLLGRVGLGNARCFEYTRDVHREIQPRFARLGGADHGCGARWQCRAGQRNMALAGEQP